MNKWSNTFRACAIQSCVLLLATSTALAQTKPKPANPIDRGSMLVGGSASFVHTDGESGDDFTDLSIVPNVLFFIAPRVAIGGEFGVTHTRSSAFTSTSWLVGPAARLFFGSGAPKTLPFIGTAVLWHTSNGDIIGSFGTISSSGLMFDGGAGITQMLSKQVGLTGEAFVRHMSNTFSQPSTPDNTSRATQFGVRFGFSAFLF
jgi:hypothetical protein